MLVQKINPTTASVEWVSKEEDDDCSLENDIAKSQYGDMLHDEQRNKRYHEAIHAAIRKTHDQGKPCHVLDIGTGSGILAMMSARCGAERVTACEVYKPMVEIAKEVIRRNHLRTKIQIISKRSTDVTVGQDLETKANVLVTEIFDSELIGEGALPTLKHALDNLLEPNGLVVPSSAEMFIQLIECPLLYSWHKLNHERVSKDWGIKLLEKMENCSGPPSLHDIHLSELEESSRRLLSAPISSFKFDFCKSSNIKMKDGMATPFTVCQSGVAHAFIVWWVLSLDEDSKIQLSTKPDWINDGRPKQWRDHWMQGVHYLDDPIRVSQDDALSVFSFHDDYSVWFSVASGHKGYSERCFIERPLCSCGAHLVWGRSRFAMLNDSDLSRVFSRVLKKAFDTGRRCCAVIGDASLLPFLADSLGMKKIVYCEHNRSITQIIHKLLKTNSRSSIHVLNEPLKGITDTRMLEHLDEGEQFDMLLAEPHLGSSILPWHNLYFWYARTYLSRWLRPGCLVVPVKASLVAMAVQFKDLWKTKVPVGCIEGFDLSDFDKYSQTRAISDDFDEQDKQNLTMAEPESYHLWEYPGWSLSNPTIVFEFDTSKTVPLDESCSTVSSIHLKSPVKTPGTCHALVFWMDYHLDDDNVLSTGLEKATESGKQLMWKKQWKQAVIFFKQFIDVDGTFPRQIRLLTQFIPARGAVCFSASLE